MRREVHDATVVPAKIITAPDSRRNSLVFGVDLRVGFMIIYRQAFTKSQAHKRRHTRGHKNEFHFEGIRCKACGRPEGAQGREHNRCEHHGSSQGRGVTGAEKCVAVREFLTRVVRADRAMFAATASSEQDRFRPPAPKAAILEL